VIAGNAAFLATAIGGYLFARTRRTRDAPGPRGDARPPERRRADERGTREALARSARAWETERAHVPVDLAAGTRDFRVALERGSPWTLGAAESAAAPNIEVRERRGRSRGTTSLSRGTASGCGVREDAPGKCRRNACSSLYKAEMEISLEASKFRKRPRDVFHDWCSYETRCKKAEKANCVVRRSRERATLPPASRERKKAKPKMAPRRAATRRKTGRHSTRGVDL
jgi:hypothetical protein